MKTPVIRLPLPWLTATRRGGAPTGLRKVAVGLSGGVDSAVSAYLLKKQGYDVHCIYMNCYDADIPGLRPRVASGLRLRASDSRSPRGCRGDQDRQDALAVALHLGLPFQVLDFRKEYKAAVIDYFKKEYLVGRTPNPDVVCNREIKFGLLLDWCLKNDFDYLATGHYAKIRDRPVGGGSVGNTADLWAYRSTGLPIFLSQPKDLHKDQTYFLWAVQRERLERVLFPLGDFRKDEVRSLAKLVKIPVAEKKDSTGICFVGEVRVEDFLKRLGVKEKEGEVVMRSALPAYRPTAYQVIGTHRGVAFYTIGQRHGFEITRWPATDRPPLYVIAKDIRNNRLVVGFGAECYRDQFVVSDCNWLASEKSEKARPWRTPRSGLNRIFVRIRHGGELIPCGIEKVRPRSAGSDLYTFLIHLRFAQRGIAAGQSAVFYSKEGIVLGGGVIQ